MIAGHDFGGIEVISRTSTRHFKSSPENLPEIAQPQ